jgi:SNF2 family DNA or RNA helicase
MHLYLIYSLKFDKNNNNNKRVIVNFKENINWNVIVNHENTIKNQAVLKHFKEVKNMYCPFIEHPSINLCFTPMIFDGVEIEILYFEFMYLELITPELISSISTVPSNIHRHIKIMNYILQEDENQFNYKIDSLIEELEKPRYFKTEPLGIEDKVRTKIFSHQYDNVHWVLNHEQNFNNYIIRNKIYKFDDGRIYCYDKNEFQTDDTVQKLRVNGGVIIDEVGTGKTLQFICLALTNPNISNLIVVPNHLKEQWISECGKHLNISIPPNLKIISFSEYLLWQGTCDRLMFDELHELYSNPSNHDVFLKAIADKATSKWGLTATPFPTKKSISSILKFLTSTNFSEDQLQNYTYNFSKYINIFKKNTREMIKFEVELPPLTVNNEIIQFTQRERNVYDGECMAGTHTDINVLRKLCCDVMLSISENSITVTYKNFSTMVKESYQKHYKTELDVLVEFENMHARACATYEQIRSEQLLANIKHLERKIQEQSDIVNSKKKSLDFIESKFADTPCCPYCLGDIDKDFCGIINLPNCNHHYCSDCLDCIIDECTMSRKTPKCSTCQQSFTRSNIIQVQNTEKKSIYPSKFNHLINILKSTDEKFIIYTQFDTIIEKLKMVLTMENIKSVVFNKFEDIEEAKNEDVKALILSSGKNASGLDLTFINKIIIFEPFIGSHAHLRDIEKQIIGRIYRNGQQSNTTVYRLIIKETIEEQIYSQMIM